MVKELKVAIIGLSGKSIFMEVEDFHKPEETIIAKSVHIEPGGKGYNQAATLLKLGAEVSFCTTVGEDHDAKDCFDYLDQVNSKLYFNQIDNEKTAIASILINSFGENRVTVYPGASKYLNMKHFETFKKEIINADILLLTLEIPIPIINAALEVAKENNVITILNPAPYNKEFKNYNLCDIIIPNELEAKQILNLNFDVNLVDYNFENLKDFPLMIITLGAKGVLVVENGKTKRIEGIKVNSLDTTGAGDVFNGSFAYYYGLTRSVEEAAQFANLAAALSTTKKYVLNAIPSLEDIERNIKI